MVAKANVQFEPSSYYLVHPNCLNSEVNLCCTVVYTDGQSAFHEEAVCVPVKRRSKRMMRREVRSGYVLGELREAHK